MPIYEYEPTLFHETEQAHECCFFETLQSVMEPVLIHCPTCGHAIHRAVSAFSAWGKSDTNKQNSTSATSLSNGAFQEKFKDIIGKIKETDSNAKQESSSTKNSVARLAARHLCSINCRH